MINVYNSQQEKELAHELSDIIKKEGYEIIRVRISKGKKINKCQIMIEKTNKDQINVIDCEKINKEVLDLLKKNPLGLHDCIIEVSSPGIDKPLTRLKDYIESKEKLVKINTLYKIGNRRSFKGYIKDINSDSLQIKLIDNNDVIILKFDSISEAWLQYEFNLK